MDTKEPLQGIILVDQESCFHDAYEPVSDPLIKEYLSMRPKKKFFKSFKSNFLPFSSNLSVPEYIPTMSYEFTKKLSSHFPNHRLILSDFDSLSDSIPGINSPVVQTRYHGEMVSVTSLLVQPGWFDIFFPTDFKEMESIYSKVTKGKQVEVMCQRKFLERYSRDLKETRTLWGENPMLSFYDNFKFMVSN